MRSCRRCETMVSMSAGGTTVSDASRWMWPGQDLSWLETLSGVKSVSGDSPVAPAPLAAEAGAQLRAANTAAPTLRALLGLKPTDPTGDGIGVAIIDSGISPMMDLKSQISAFYDFTNGQGGVATAPVDGYGHGTHVAGLVAGSGYRSQGQVCRSGARRPSHRPPRLGQLGQRVNERRHCGCRVRDRS